MENDNSAHSLHAALHTVRKLEAELGMQAIALKYKVGLLVSCEEALKERDNRIADLKDELKKKEERIKKIRTQYEAN